jgi:hypothetical protein
MKIIWFSIQLFLEYIKQYYFPKIHYICVIKDHKYIFFLFSNIYLFQLSNFELWKYLKTFGIVFHYFVGFANLNVCIYKANLN